MVELRELCGSDLRVIDPEHLDGVFFTGFEAVLVDPDHRLLPRVDAGLRTRSRLLDPKFRNASIDGSGHASHILDLGDVGHRLVGKFVGEPLDVMRPTPRVDGLGRTAFLLQE